MTARDVEAILVRWSMVRRWCSAAQGGVDKRLHEDTAAMLRALQAENERLREALGRIAKSDYGYMDILESGAPPEKHADYFCSMVVWRQHVARAALAGGSNG